MLSGPNDESPANVEAAVSSIINFTYLTVLLQPTFFRFVDTYLYLRKHRGIVTVGC